MRVVDEKPLETIHLYVVREEKPKPPLLPIFLSGLALFVLLVLCVFSSYQQPELRVSIRVPAVFLPLQTFSAIEPIISTGIKTYVATTAHGVLTLYNGSIITQQIPKGFLLQSKNGIEIVTDASVFIPSGSANGFGFATVSAHAAVSGKAGNIPAYTIDRVEGSSLYIRNLTSFHGGKDSYTVALQLPQDRQTALEKARNILSTSYRPSIDLLAKPCREVVNGAVKLVVKWTCQFYTYSVSPLIHITKVKLSGKTVFVEGFIVVRPNPFIRK